MEFKNQYLTYLEYKNLGGTLGEMPFNLLEFKARKIIDERTLGRLDAISQEYVPQDVKLCVYDIIDILDKYDKSREQNKNIASESIDGYSISYKTSEVIAKAEEIELESSMQTNLSGVRVNNIPLLYLGVESYDN